MKKPKVSSFFVVEFILILVVGLSTYVVDMGIVFYTPTPTLTSTPTPTNTLSATLTSTLTFTQTPTVTPTVTPTYTLTTTPSRTLIPPTATKKPKEKDGRNNDPCADWSCSGGGNQ